MRLVTSLLIFALSIFSTSAFAYCFTAFSGNKSFQVSGSTGASEACRKLIDSAGITRSGNYGAVSGDGAVGGKCYYYPSDTALIAYYGEWSRTGELETMCAAASNAGTSCTGTGTALSPFGHVIDSAGQCVDYTRADTAAQCKSLSGTASPHTLYVNFDGDGNPLTPPPINARGCEAVAATVGHCKMAPARTFPTGGSIQPTTNKCKVMVSFTGNTVGSAPVAPPISTAPGIDGVCPPGEACPDVPDAPIANNSQPCTYVEDGEGRRVCSSNNYNYQPGNSSCGAVNGQFVCIGKAPETNGIKIDTQVVDKNNADGTKTSTKTDTATQVNCTGNNSCTAKVTTNTTVTVYNSSGTKVSQSTTCTGPACSVGGKGDSDGDGMNDCALGKDCSETDEPGEVGEMPSLDEASDYGDSLSGYYQRLTNAPILKSVTSLSVPEGGSCSGSSVTIEYIGTINTSAFCDLLNTLLAPLRYVFMAIWAWAAIRTFLTA